MLTLNIYSNFFELDPRPGGDTYSLNQIQEWDPPEIEVAEEFLDFIGRGVHRPLLSLPPCPSETSVVQHELPSVSWVLFCFLQLTCCLVRVFVFSLTNY